MHFLICGFIYCLFSMNILRAKAGLSQDITSSSSRRRVVVFDVDDTLCKSPAASYQVENAVKYYPECPVLFWDNKSGLFKNESHVFLPYLQILFDYLIEQDVRIVFFSSAVKERNLLVLPQLLTSLWGELKFEALKAQGQFDIFSKNNLRENRSFITGEVHHSKDLTVVIREGELLSDVILVDDNYAYSAHDQRPPLVCMFLSYWTIREEQEEKSYILSRERTQSSFNLNSVYFMIGVFKTYFENEKYKILPFREALKVILPKSIKYSHAFFEKHSFAYEMYDLGLSEVQKRVPNATFYGLRHTEIGTYGNESWYTDDSQY